MANPTPASKPTAAAQPAPTTQPTTPADVQAAAAAPAPAPAPKAPAPAGPSAEKQIAALKAQVAALQAQVPAQPIDGEPGSTVRPNKGPLNPTTGEPLFNVHRPTGRAG